MCHLLPLCQLNPLPRERGRGTTGGMAQVEVFCRGLFLVVFEWQPLNELAPLLNALLPLQAAFKHACSSFECPVFSVLNCLVCHLLPLCQLNPLPRERGRGTTGGMAQVEVFCRGLFLVVFE